MTSKRKMGFLSKVLLLVLCLAVLAGCATQQATDQKPAQSTDKPADKPQTQDGGQTTTRQMTIRYMSPATAGGQSQQYEILNNLIAKFQEEHPGVTIIHDALPTADLRTKLTVEMASGNPPHCSWSPLNYAREFMRDNAIIDWRPVYEDPKHKEFKEWFDEKVLEFSAYKDGRLMMAPYEASIDGLFYNSEIFEKYGWEPPKTFDDLIDLAAKCREQGIYAIVTGGKDMRFAWMAAALMARAAGVENLKQLALGDALTKWNDPQYGFPQAMQKFKQLVDAGAFPPGTVGLSADEADRMFVRGEVAMYYEGQWKPGNWLALGGEEFLDKVKRVNFPAMPDMPNGDPNVCVGGTIVGTIAASQKPQDEIDMTIEWVKVVSSPAYYVAGMEAGANLYAGKTAYDRNKPPRITNDLYDAFQAAGGYIPSMDTLAPPAIDLDIKQTAMPGILSGELTVEEAIAEVQKAAEEYAKSLE